MHTDPQPITAPEALVRFCREAREAGRFALDMEFESERSYWPKLQLLQAATPDRAVLVDPLALRDLGPMWELILDPAIITVVHAGRQDAEIVYSLTGGVPRGVFDTQMASALLGLGEQIGYAALVGRELGKRVHKGERVTDWSRRPLSPAQAQYALDDVVYLPSLHELLVRRLEERGRTAWLEEEQTFYGEEGTYRRDPGTCYLRIGKRGSMDRRTLGVLRELASWRELEAERRNSPRGRVLPDDVLVEIAGRRPARPGDLAPLRRLHPRERERSGDDLVAAVQRALSLPEDQLPEIPRSRPEDPDHGLVTHLLDVLVRIRGREHDIAPSYIANQRSLRRLVEFLAGDTGDGEPEVLRGWRREIVGEDLVAAVQGKTGVRMDPELGLPVVENRDS